MEWQIPVHTVASFKLLSNFDEIVLTSFYSVFSLIELTGFQGSLISFLHIVLYCMSCHSEV